MKKIGLLISGVGILMLFVSAVLAIQEKSILPFLPIGALLSTIGVIPIMLAKPKQTVRVEVTVNDKKKNRKVK